MTPASIAPLLLPLFLCASSARQAASTCANRTRFISASELSRVERDAQHDPELAIRLGHYYVDRNDEACAMRFYRLGAALGSPGAHYQVAHLLLYGEGAPDFSGARSWLEKGLHIAEGHSDSLWIARFQVELVTLGHFERGEDPTRD